MTIGTIARGGFERTHCSRCGAEQDGLTKVHPYCRRCRRNDRLVRMYGRTADEIDALIAAVDGKCPICHRATQRWAVDHDHSCCPGKLSCGDCVRGVICDDCNRGLGMFQDSPEALRAAADYLEVSRA